MIRWVLILVSLLLLCGWGITTTLGGSAPTAGGAGSGDTVTASITVSAAATDTPCDEVGDTCVAPLAVHFHARSTTCNTSECDDDPFDNEAFHKLYYVWDFGDVRDPVEYWDVSGQSKNVEYGPEAVHVFDSAGTYVVTLTAYSGTASNEDTVTIYVDDPETVFADTTACVANGTTPEAGVGGCPSVADRLVNSSDFDASIESAQSAWSGPGRILFKAGDTFYSDNDADINYDGPGIIGSYGAANDGRAYVDATASADVSNGIFEANVGFSVEDWRIMDFEVTQGTPAAEQWTQKAVVEYDGYQPAWERSLFYRFKRVSGGRFLSMQRTYNWDAPDYDYSGAVSVFAVDNDVTGLYNVFHVAWTVGGIVGNQISGQSPIYTNGNHLIRIGSPGRWSDIVIAHNEFNCCSSMEATVRGEDNDTVNSSGFMTIRENIFHDWRESCSANWCGFILYPKGDIGVSYDLIRDIIVENNFFETWFMTVIKTVTVRNNIFAPTYSLGRSAIIISDSHGDDLPAHWVDDVMIYNNSMFDTVSTQDMISVELFEATPSTLPDAYYIVNNLYWNSSLDAGAEVYDCGSYCANGTFTTNIDHSDSMSSTPFAVSTPLTDDITDWYLSGAGASAPINAGTALGSQVYDDFEHTARDDGNYDIGAIED